MLLILLTLFLPHGALAQGSETGNGGESLVCRHPLSGVITRIVVRDLHDGLSKAGKISSALMAPTTLEIVEKVLKGIASHSPRTAARLKAEIGVYFDRHERVSRLLPPTHDSGTFEPRQAIYLVQDEHWAAMNETHRAAILLHEVVARLHINLNIDSNSLRTQWIIWSLFSNNKADSKLLLAPLEQWLVFNSKI